MRDAGGIRNRNRDPMDKRELKRLQQRLRYERIKKEKQKANALNSNQRNETKVDGSTSNRHDGPNDTPYILLQGRLIYDPKKEAKQEANELNSNQRSETKVDGSTSNSRDGPNDTQSCNIGKDNFHINHSQRPKFQVYTIRNAGGMDLKELREWRERRAEYYKMRDTGGIHNRNKDPIDKHELNARKKKEKQVANALNSIQRSGTRVDGSTSNSRDGPNDSELISGDMAAAEKHDSERLNDITQSSQENGHTDESEDPVKVSSPKRTEPNRVAKQSQSTNANGHLVYVRRKPEAESPNSKYINRVNSSRCSPPRKVATEEKLLSEKPPICNPQTVPMLTCPMTCSTPGKLSPDIKEEVGTDSCALSLSITPSDRTKRMKTHHWEERYSQLQEFLAMLDHSNQENYVQMLRSLSSEDLSSQAVRLEKRSIQLSLEEVFL